MSETSKVRVRRVCAGEYVTTNTLPVVQFSRINHDAWEMRYPGFECRVPSKAGGAGLVAELAALARSVDMQAPIRIVR